LPSIITLTAGQKALLRISDLDVTEYQTLASLGIPMKVIGYNAKLLRDQAGNNMYYTTNSITLAGGESLDVILDSTGIPPGTYYLYTPNLDHLSNDAENFGGLMTEVGLTRSAAMRAMNMKTVIAKTQLLPVLVVALALLLTASAYAAAPGITGTSFSLTAGAAYTTQPDGALILHLGLWLHHASPGECLPAGYAGCTCRPCNCLAPRSSSTPEVLYRDADE